MPQILYPSEVILTEGTKLDIGWLQQGTRQPQQYQITAASYANIGDTSIDITTNEVGLLIQAGTILEFSNQTLVVREDAISIGDSAPTLLTFSKPLTAPLPGFFGDSGSSDYAFTKALMTVAGLKEASPQGQTQTVDVSNFLSGFGQENVVTGVNRTLQCSGFVIKGDRATDRIIKQLILNDEKARREIYAELNLPSGERYEGAAKIENYNTTTNVRNVQEFSFSLMFQGASFIHTPATVYTPVAQDL